MSIGIVDDPQKGFEPHMRRIEGAIKATPQQMRRAIGLALAETVRVIKNYAPVKSGALRRGIHYTQPDWYYGTVTGGTKYTRIQDRGGKTKPHDIAPKNAKVLAWPAPAGSPFMNAMRFGKGKTRGMTGANISSAFARTASGKAITGLYFHWPKGRIVKHPGSRIKAKEFSSRGFDEARPKVLRIIAAAGKSTIETGGTR